MSPDALAEAQAVFDRMKLEKLAASPLAGMADWVKTGAPPPAAALRAAGLRADAPDGDWWIVRKAFVPRWGFSIPCAEAVSALAGLTPLVELGAGSGYWSALLRAAGVDIVATDKTAEGTPGYGLEAGLHSQIEALDGVAAVQAYPDRNVFCSWPTEGDDWCAHAAARVRPGRAFALISKGRGGNVGSPALFDVLDRLFAPERRVELPQFPGSHDELVVYRRLS